MGQLHPGSALGSEQGLHICLDSIGCGRGMPRNATLRQVCVNSGDAGGAGSEVLEYRRCAFLVLHDVPPENDSALEDP